MMEHYTLARMAIKTLLWYPNALWSQGLNQPSGDHGQLWVEGVEVSWGPPPPADVCSFQSKQTKASPSTGWFSRQVFGYLSPSQRHSWSVSLLYFIMV
jgi:hypothetical protein